MSESKMKPRLRAEELTGIISLLRDSYLSNWYRAITSAVQQNHTEESQAQDRFVRSENLTRCCFVPIRRKAIHSPEYYNFLR